MCSAPATALDDIMKLDGRAASAASSSICARARSASPIRPATGRPPDGEGHEEARRRESEWREIGLGAQILKDLGISSINLIASRERHYVGLEGFGIRIARTEIL